MSIDPAGVSAPRKVDPERPWHLYIVFDGGSRGNPGQGYGSFVYKGVVQQPEPVEVVYPGVTTNNQAEYQTMIRALETALGEIQDAGYDTGELKVTIKTDSKLVVEQTCGRWKIKNAELRPLVQRAQSLLNRFKSWELTWHPRTESVRILGH
jgi:ribonuclease HI